MANLQNIFIIENKFHKKKWALQSKVSAPSIIVVSLLESRGILNHLSFRLRIRVFWGREGSLQLFVINKF